MASENLHNARKNQNDEFYTLYEDIQKEVNAYIEYDENVFRGKTILLPCDDPEWSNFTKFFAQNFERFGLKKLRDEADIIITNPPFSLFKEFLAWVVETNKQFLIIGNMNAITYKEIFSLIKENKIWLGFNSGDMSFQVPKYYEVRETRYWEDENGQKWRSLGNIYWYTNIEHGKRHRPLELMTMEDNLKFNKKLLKKFKVYNTNIYPKYDNYDAFEIPYVDAIPSDNEDIMGVPITFLDKYNPNQFIILGIMNTGEENKGIRYENTPHGCPLVNGIEIYFRILIKLNNNN